MKELFNISTTEVGRTKVHIQISIILRKSMLSLWFKALLMILTAVLAALNIPGVREWLEYINALP